MAEEARNHVSAGQAYAHDEARPHGGLRDALGVQAPQEGTEEGARQRAPADGHELRDERDRRAVLHERDDCGNGHERYEQAAHPCKLTLLIHVLHDVVFQQVERERARRGEHKRAQGRHRGRKHEHDYETDEQIGQSGSIVG